jgi:Mn-dependent DtxR family transcriptional regulator
MTEDQALAAIMQLHTLGLINFKDDTSFTIAEPGIEKAKELLGTLPLLDRVLVTLAVPQIMYEVLQPTEE